jgi:hypothetical protein
MYYRLVDREGHNVALDDPFAPVHHRAPHVDKLGIFRKQLSKTVRVLGVQGDGEGIDDVTGL